MVPLPDEALTLTQIGPVTLRPELWWLVQPLWTAEEGRSDLDIIGGVARRTDGSWTVYIDDLRGAMASKEVPIAGARVTDA